MKFKPHCAEDSRPPICSLALFEKLAEIIQHARRRDRYEKQQPAVNTSTNQVNKDGRNCEASDCGGDYLRSAWPKERPSDQQHARCRQEQCSDADQVISTVGLTEKVMHPVANILVLASGVRVQQARKGEQ